MKISEEKRGEPSISDIESIVDCARWAPTGDNVQQFTFEWDGQVLRVREDSGRSQAFLNVRNIASQMALGMCLANIEIGAESKGWKAQWKLVPEGEFVARVTFESMSVSASPWIDAVRARTVDRRPYRPDPVPPGYADEWMKLTQNPWGIRFHLLTEPERVGEMARINGKFESFMFDHREIHGYFYRWFRRTDAEAEKTGDGLPLSTLGVGSLDALGLRLMVTWGVARIFALLGFTHLASLRAQRLYRRSAAFGVFTVPNNDSITFVQVGWLWERLWLKLTMDGWALQPVMGNVLMGFLCRTRAGADFSDRQITRFSQGEQEMNTLITLKETESMACVFRLGRPVGPVPARGASSGPCPPPGPFPYP
jgi:hypothetical protein